MDYFRNGLDVMGGAQAMMIAAGGGGVVVTWNPVDKDTDVSLSGGNLIASANSANAGSCRATMGKSSGKWYWEVVISDHLHASACIGLASASLVNQIYIDAAGWGYTGEGNFITVGQKINTGSATGYGVMPTNGSNLGVALDMTAGTVQFYFNNSAQGVAYTGLTGVMYPAASFNANGSGTTITAKFSAGSFTYAPPSGFAALA